MVETYINGNISVFRELYRELNKDARREILYRLPFLMRSAAETYGSIT